MTRKKSRLVGESHRTIVGRLGIAAPMNEEVQESQNGDQPNKGHIRRVVMDKQHHEFMSKTVKTELMGKSLMEN